jgi:hypothetical protein
LYGIWQRQDPHSLANLYLDLFPTSDRTKQSVKTKIQNMKHNLLKKLSTKAPSLVEDNGMFCFIFINILEYQQYEEFCQSLFIYSTDNFYLVYAKAYWKEIKV